MMADLTKNKLFGAWNDKIKNRSQNNKNAMLVMKKWTHNNDSNFYYNNKKKKKSLTYDQIDAITH
uniref:Uncharacterized protein n=1 Tax=Rhizophora mucronata TaxID=61149 RepID=A0A2P2MY47_RHIMU